MLALRHPQTTLTVIAGGRRGVADARLDTDRWTNEGGRVAAEAAAPVH